MQGFTEKNSCIFITGGHATPAVACINELHRRGFNNIVYIGQKKTILFDKNVSSEYTLIKEKLGIPFKPIIAGKLSLFLDINSFIWLCRMPIGFIHALYFHFRYRPKLILTFGSHVGLPVVFWAWIFRVPVVAHEQTVTLGRANRIIQKFATKVCYSWENTTSHKTYQTHPEKFIYTGNPIRKEIFEVITDKFIFADKNKRIIFITGGNQGAHSMNEYFFARLNEIAEQYNIIHQTGSNTVYNDIEKAKRLAEKLNATGLKYIPAPYIFAEEMAEAYAKAFVVIGRAGANTITELLVLKKKSILVPIPTTSGNEQFLNAAFLEKLGLSLVVNQSDLDKTDILQLLKSAEDLKLTNENEVIRLSNIHREAEKRIVDCLLKN